MLDFFRGVLSHHNRTCLIGRSAEQGFEQVFADLAFFSTKALSTDGVISDCTQEEVFVRNSMLKNARKRVGLFNREKIGKRSSFKQCTLSEIDLLISDEVSELEIFSDMCEIM